MSQFELMFLDGPGAGRSVWADRYEKKVWLCNKLGKRWLTFREPDRVYVEALYKMQGQRPRLDGSALIVYVVEDDRTKQT